MVVFGLTISCGGAARGAGKAASGCSKTGKAAGCAADDATRVINGGNKRKVQCSACGGRGVDYNHYKCYRCDGTGYTN